MKITLTSIVFSTLLTTHASALIGVNELGYPFNTPGDYTSNTGDLSFEQVFDNDLAKEIMQQAKSKIREIKTPDEMITFLTNPTIVDYLIRETKTWEELSDPVVKSYVTTTSLLNSKIGENFRAVFAPDSYKAFNLISLAKTLLPEEAKIHYLLNPVMENGYFTQDQKMGILQYVKDNFSIPEQSVQQYINEMRNFSPS